MNSSRKNELVAEPPSDVEVAREDLVHALEDTREKVRDLTGLKLRRSWVAPIVAGAAGLGLALWLRSRKKS